MLTPGRVREWRLGHVLVSIPCNLDPCVKFSLILLFDNLLHAARIVSVTDTFNSLPHQASINHSRHSVHKISLR